MSEPFIGQIQTFGFDYAPRGWARCDGQLLPISNNQALFALLGTTYGGDGQTTFGLPDLRGRTTLHVGLGAGLSSRQIGQRGGAQNVLLSQNQIPAHTHTASLRARAEDGTLADPLNNLLAAGNIIYSAGGADTKMASDAISINHTGGDGAHNNMQPFLVINWCIALTGVFPSRP